MAFTILGLGIAATSPLVPTHLRGAVQKALDAMEADMQASPYDWEMLYIEPDMDIGLLIEKLKVKEWDGVMVGMGLRTGSQVPFFEKIINTVHEVLPKAKFVFNHEITKTKESCDRVFAP